MFDNYFRNRRVLLTGHTGFKGSWLASWLVKLGADVCGFALDPQPHEKLFDQLELGKKITSDVRGDITDYAAVKNAVSEFLPEVVLHLAAQPLVRLSYNCPAATFNTNVMGTVHVLEAVRQSDIACTVVCITTDKCYENREWLHAYREHDAMGGHDPYSASKGAAEIAIASYRRSFFSDNSRVRVASARAGNVLGGGDWALDRIVPDSIRSIRANQPVKVRNKVATRPWQHVLEPLSGYLSLASLLARAPSDEAGQLSSAFNFGPDLNSNHTVLELVTQLLGHIGGEWQDISDPDALHEASKLNLAIDKAFHLLKWQPAWNFAQTIKTTADWYMREESGENPASLTESQISEYQQSAQALKLPWAISESDH